MVLLRGIEPPTYTLPMCCSTPELQQPAYEANWIADRKKNCNKELSLRLPTQKYSRKHNS